MVSQVTQENARRNAPGRPPRWTKEELAYLDNNYGRHTAEQLAEMINKQFNRQRSRDAIVAKASRRLLGYYCPPNYTRLCWVYPDWTGGKMRRIVNAAKRDGVLRKLYGTRGGAFVAPIKWVDAWLAAEEAGPSEYEISVIRNTWLNSRDAAKLYGIPVNKFCTYAFNQNHWLRAHVPNAVRYYQDTLAHGKPYYWNPTDLRALLPQWRAYQRTQKGRKPIDNLIHNAPKEAKNAS